MYQFYISFSWNVHIANGLLPSRSIKHTLFDFSISGNKAIKGHLFEKKMKTHKKIQVNKTVKFKGY